MSVIDNTASILTRRRRFSRTMQDVYYLPIMISDGGIPSLSSSSTLTIRVCACERDGRVRTCHAEAFLSSAGLSTGALIAILLCVVILLGKWLQFREVCQLSEGGWGVKNAYTATQQNLTDFLVMNLYGANTRSSLIWNLSA